MNFLTLAMTCTLGLPGQSLPSDRPDAPAGNAISLPGNNIPGAIPALGAVPQPPVEVFTPLDNILCPPPERQLFESDHAFDNFVGPTTNPILAKDPRSSTYARLLFINNEIPGSNPLGGGNFQAYAMQVNIALTDRLTLIADKDGIASIHPGAAASTTGLMDLAAGLKYTFWRDVQNQTLAAIGFLYEANSGEANVFQHNNGNGLFSIFLTGGKEFCNYWHVLNTLGCQFGAQAAASSSFIYDSLHIDRQLFGWFYPLAELNMFHYTSGGNSGVPNAVGEGDGLLNLGTSAVGGQTLVTGAIGAKAILSCNATLGAAWEFPLTGQRELINNRLTVEFILRY